MDADARAVARRQLGRRRRHPGRKLDFVQTSAGGGLRLALRLCRARKPPMLVDPATGSTQDVPLPAGPSRKIRRITKRGQRQAPVRTSRCSTARPPIRSRSGSSGPRPARRIAASTPTTSASTSLRSSTSRLASPISSRDRKIHRAAAPARRSSFTCSICRSAKAFRSMRCTNLTLNLSPDGEQLWAFERDQTAFAQLTFDPLQPSSLYTQRPIAFVHDFATQHGGGERTALALHILPTTRPQLGGRDAVRRARPEHGQNQVLFRARASGDQVMTQVRVLGLGASRTVRGRALERRPPANAAEADHGAAGLAPADQHALGNHQRTFASTSAAAGNSSRAAASIRFRRKTR